MPALPVPSGLNLAEKDTLIPAVRAIREFTPAPFIRRRFIP